MQWVSILLIGIASNLDNLGIGVSFGIRSTKIPIISNVIIALISMVSAYVSISMGSLIANSISRASAQWIGGIIIAVIGLWTLFADMYKNKRKAKTSDDHILREVIQNPTKADLDQNHVISWKESVMLGLALALNCLATGFGAGISGISAYWIAISVGLFSLITVDVGVRTGCRFASSWFGKYSNVIAGFILIGIGIYEITM